MNLQVRCTSCKEWFDIKSKSYSRPDLVDENGEYFNETCTKCGVAKEYHANDVKAYDGYGKNLLGSIIGIGVMILSSKILWDLGFISNVGLIVGAGIIIASNASTFTSNTTAFNKYLVTRNPKNTDQ